MRDENTGNAPQGQARPRRRRHPLPLPEAEMEALVAEVQEGLNANFIRGDSRPEPFTVSVLASRPVVKVQFDLYFGSPSSFVVVENHAHWAATVRRLPEICGMDVPVPNHVEGYAGKAGYLAVHASREIPYEQFVRDRGFVPRRVREANLREM